MLQDIINVIESLVYKISLNITLSKFASSANEEHTLLL
jgi:hypothetical protein